MPNCWTNGHYSSLIQRWFLYQPHCLNPQVPGSWHQKRIQIRRRKKKKKKMTLYLPKIFFRLASILQHLKKFKLLESSIFDPVSKLLDSTIQPSERTLWWGWLHYQGCIQKQKFLLWGQSAWRPAPIWRSPSLTWRWWRGRCPCLSWWWGHQLDHNPSTTDCTDMVKAPYIWNEDPNQTTKLLLMLARIALTMMIIIIMLPIASKHSDIRENTTDGVPEESIPTIYLKTWHSPLYLGS